MNELLEELIKQKIYGYIRGDLSSSDLYDWVKARKEFAGAVEHIKNRSDTVFFLVNRAGLETSNFYTEESIGIKREALIKKINKLLAQEITAEEIYDWADDIINWELVEGFEDNILKAAIREISMDSERLNHLTENDWGNIIRHLQESKDEETSIPSLRIIFLLPGFREIILSPKPNQEKLGKIQDSKNLTEDYIYFDRFLNSMTSMLQRNTPIDQFDRFFDEASKGSLS